MEDLDNIVYIDTRQGCTVEYKYIYVDSYGRELKKPIWSVSIDSSVFVPVRDILEESAPVFG